MIILALIPLALALAAIFIGHLIEEDWMWILGLAIVSCYVILLIWGSVVNLVAIK